MFVGEVGSGAQRRLEMRHEDEASRLLRSDDEASRLLPDLENDLVAFCAQNFEKVVAFCAQKLRHRAINSLGGLVRKRGVRLGRKGVIHRRADARRRK